MAIEQKDINNIINTIISGYDPEIIILFGSYAKENFQEESDLDLLIVKDTNEPYHTRAHKVRSLFNPQPCAMDIFVYSSDEFKKLKHLESLIPGIANKEGKVLYARRNQDMD